MDKSTVSVTTPSAASSPYPQAVPGADGLICSDALFASGNEVLIQHHGEQYRLRRTRNGKLILTK